MRLAKIIRYLKNDSGNVESVLVILPLLSLFLITLQLIATVNLRNVDMTTAQNRASYQATQSTSGQSHQMMELDSGDLFSKLRLLIVRVERDIPQIFPGLGNLLGGKTLSSSGVAVYEEREECSGGYLLC